MAIRDTISRLFRRTEPEPTTVDESPVKRTGAKPGIAAMFGSETGRYDIVTTCRAMYDKDPRVKTILQTLARDATKGGFILETKDEKAAEVVEELRARLDLGSRLDDWCRLTFRDGDTFLQLGVNRRRQIAEVVRLPTLEMHRNSNKRDTFSDPDKAFWHSDRPWITTPGDDVTWLAHWEIIHARWDHDEGSRYGTPMMASARSAWKRVKEGEMDIAVRRKTRAGIKYLHQVDGDESDVEAYMERNKAVIENPFAAIADFFFNKKVNLTAVQGDANLGDISDVLHHIKTMWMASPVPMAILGYGEEIDYSVVEHQKEQYDETLTEVQAWVAGQFLKPLFERQWLLAGMLPEDVEYAIAWSPKNRVSAKDVADITKAGLQMQALGFRPEAIAMALAPFLPGIAPEDFFEGDELSAERLANASAALLRGLNG